MEDAWMIQKEDRIYDIVMKDKTLEQIFRKHGIRCFG